MCEYCLECTKATGCPGLKTIETDYGPKIGIDPSNCVSDGACARIKWACPAFEEVTVIRKRPPRAQTDINGIAGATSIGNPPDEQLPTPPMPDFDQTWSAYAAGVGGMGIGTLSKILVVAGRHQGYHIRFADKKGIAIRNGAVYSHIIYSKTKGEISPIIPYGKADLLLGLDILEAVRGIDSKAGARVGAPDKTVAVVNTAKADTVTTLIGKEHFEIPDLENWLQTYTKPEEYFGVDVFELSERLLGNKLYANIMLLGVAFQRGLLPLEFDTIQLGIQEMVRPADLETNQRAFEIGRWLVVQPDRFTENTETPTYEHTLQEKRTILEKKWRGQALAQAYESLVQQAVTAMPLDDETNRGLALRVYNLIEFEDINYARLYVEKIKGVYAQDSPEENHRATKAAIKYLHKVMLIKDEVYVAHLLTSAEKLKRDQQHYNVDEANGDKIKYVHLNRPRFTIMGFNFEREISPRNWQLGLMKKMKFLRRWLSQWHTKEKGFRDWYTTQVIDTFAPTDAESYENHVRAIEVPEEVRGYREVRHPKMEAAREKVAELLENSPR